MYGPVNVKNRRVSKDLPVGDYFKGQSEVYDAVQRMNIVKIFSGDWHVSTDGNEMLSTILGSCVSACIHDPALRIGGMNHFLLPGDNYPDDRVSDSSRYGVYAMECLINGLLKAGGNKSRFEVKVFGGGNVMRTRARIGSMNAQFIRSFLRKEGLQIVSEDLEGDFPRRVNYYPSTGKVMLRQLRRKEDMLVVDEENRFNQQLKSRPIEGEIELF